MLTSPSWRPEHAELLLLRALGEIQKPILLKRGMSATIEELLLSAEYIMSGGNYNVILCERGIRTFDTYMRNTMDIAAIPVIKSLSHLPDVADPSHGTGRRDKVAAMARAAVAAGADGLLVEVHQDPERALSDGAQSLYPDQFDAMMKEIRAIAPAVEDHCRCETASSRQPVANVRGMRLRWKRGIVRSPDYLLTTHGAGRDSMLHPLECTGPSPKNL